MKHPQVGRRVRSPVERPGGYWISFVKFSRIIRPAQRLAARPGCFVQGCRRLEGFGLAHETDRTQSHEKADLAMRIPPSAERCVGPQLPITPLCRKGNCLFLPHSYAFSLLALAIQSMPVTSCCPSTKLNCAACS